MSRTVNQEAVYRTALATPGLLKESWTKNVLKLSLFFNFDILLVLEFLEQKLHTIFNRPGVYGAFLQTPLSLIYSFIHSFIE